MLSSSPFDCPVCRPHVAALQRYLDGIDALTLGEVLVAARRVVEEIHRSRCGVAPECLLLRDDLDERTRRSLQCWVDSVGPILIAT